MIPDRRRGAVRNARWHVALASTVAALSIVTPAMSGGPHPRDTTKTAFVAALDATGKPLTTLTRADWGVREDGVDRPIVEAIRATEPVTYTRPDGATPKVLQMAVAHPGAQMLVPRTPPR